jgi:hypothetical protein
LKDVQQVAVIAEVEPLAAIPWIPTIFPALSTRTAIHCPVPFKVPVASEPELVVFVEVMFGAGFVR